MMLLTKELRKKFPKLGATENKPDAKVIARYFALGSSWTWYAFEFDGDDTFFGYVQGIEPEWGYFSLSELQSLKFMGIPRIERDLYYEPQTKAQLDPRMKDAA